MKFRSIYTKIGIYFMLTIGSLICAGALNLFLVPNKIASGGVSGFAIVLHHLFNYPVGVVMIIINIPLFIMGLRRLGMQFSIRTIYASLLFSYFVDSLSFLKPFTTNMLLASVYGGLIMGVGFAVVLRFNATTGGTDLLAAIICNYIKHLKIGQVLMMIDGFVIVFAGFAFKDQEIMLYAFVSIFISSKVINVLLSGVNFGKIAYIISEYSDVIANEIIIRMKRGVTGLRASGMYTGSDKTVLLCVLKPNQIYQLKKIVKEIDSNAFIILTDAKEVLGEGFNI